MGGFPATIDDLFSVEGNFGFRKADRLHMELGYSTGDRYNMEMNRGGNAGRFRTWPTGLNYYATFLKDLRFNVTSRWSGPDFAGRYSELQHTMGVNFP